MMKQLAEMCWEAHIECFKDHRDWKEDWDIHKWFEQKKKGTWREVLEKWQKREKEQESQLTKLKRPILEKHEWNQRW